MWSVRTIPPNNLVPTQLKVAAYCRVSTNSLEQQTSLSSQEQYYEEWIKRIPHWTFAGIYSDIGSGTQAKGRRRFNAMISACQRGKIDTILTKSAHRFARNTVDALETIRMLRRWKVDIYFEIEGIHSLYESSEFLLAVVCARAQEESYSKSEDIKWGLRKAFENPESRYYQRICYGYTHNKDGRLVINEKEAQIVRLIYEMAGEGKSLSRINLLLYFLRIFLDHKFAHRQKKSARRMGTFHRRAGFATFQLALRLHRFLAWKFVMECSLRSSGCLTSAFAVSRSIFSAANCCISSVMWEYVFRVVALDT